MGIIRSRSLISRAKTNENRVYVPADSRDNQYIITEIDVTDSLIAQCSDNALKPTAKDVLNGLVTKLRRYCKAHDINYAAVVASNKFIRVRFGVDNDVNSTHDQHIFYYNPKTSRGVITLCDNIEQLETIRLVCFATGDSIRENAASFHQKVNNMVSQIKHDLNYITSVKIQDHQHISFNIEKHSPETQSKAHGFRVLQKRYEMSNVTLPNECNSKAFVVIKANFSDLYDDVVLEQGNNVSQMHYDNARILFELAKEQNIENLAYVASNRYPVVKSNFVSNKTHTKQELTHLNFGKNQHETMQIIDADYSNSQASLVFYINEEHVVKSGYASYINQIIKLVNKLSIKLALSQHDKTMLLRFYQHFSYKA